MLGKREEKDIHTHYGAIFVNFSFSCFDIDLFTIFSQTNFLPFSIIAAPRRSPNSDSFYFLTLFSFFSAASSP